MFLLIFILFILLIFIFMCILCVAKKEDEYLGENINLDRQED